MSGKHQISEAKMPKPLSTLGISLGALFLILGMLNETPMKWIMFVLAVVFSMSSLIYTTKTSPERSTRWSELSPKEKRIRLVVLSLLAVLIAAGVITALITTEI